MNTEDRPPIEKPLGIKAYGSIGHLPGSRQGRDDKGLTPGQAAILTNKVRDKHDYVIVTQKVDGSNVAVAKIGSEIVPLIRAGYRAKDSKYVQHHHFHRWAIMNRDRFDRLLSDGERLCGEWLAQTHGTRYNLPHEAFVAFDLIRGHERVAFECLQRRTREFGFILPQIVSWGKAVSVEHVMAQLDPRAHGALDPIEGAVWRVERKGVVDFLGKFVRPDKIDGSYLPEISGAAAIWNTCAHCNHTWEYLPQ